MKNKILSSLQNETNLTYNVEKGVLYGTYKEYYTYVQAFKTLIVISLPVKLTETYTINEMNSLLSTITKDYKNIISAAYNNNEVNIRYEAKTGRKSNLDNILSIINILIEAARINSLITCCPRCGEYTNISPFLINTVFAPCCDNCKLDTKNSIAEHQEAIKSERGNILTGIVGAFLGSLIGVALWVIVGLLGYIAAISGFVLAICTIKGYQLFGGKLNKKGMAITLLITIVMVYVSQYVSLGFDIYNELKTDYVISIFESIQLVPDALTDSETSNYFYGYLALGYLFTIIGTFSLFKESFKQANFKIKTEEFV